MDRRVERESLVEMKEMALCSWADIIIRFSLWLDD
jgi:hypothetical protein